MFCGVDDVSVWVLEFAHAVKWTDLVAPVPLPPPMQDFVFRPLSLLLMKATWVLSGDSLAIPPWLIGLKAAMFSAMFGVGAWLWLQRWVSKSAATVIAVVSMVAEPALFSAFNYSEFDGFGSGLILLSSWWLYKYPTRLVGFALLSFCIVFLKESSFFIWLCFLLPQLLEPWFNDRSRNIQDYRHLGIVICWMLLWFIGTSTVLSGKVQSAAGGLGWVDRLPIFQYTTWQLVTLWTETGLVIALLGYWTRWRHWWFSLWGICALYAPMTTYNHYETYYYSRPLYITTLSAGLMVTWLHASFVWMKGRTDLFTITACRGLLMMGLFALVIFTSSNLREDLATRLFLSLLPGMLGVIWQTVEAWWSDTTLRKIAVILLGLQCWNVVAAAWNWTQRTWFDAGNHAGWTVMMLENLNTERRVGQPIWVTDVSRRYSLNRLNSLQSSMNSQQITGLDFAPFCYFQAGEPSEFARSMRSNVGRDTYVIHRGQQLELDPSSLKKVVVDYSYLRTSNRGAHGPINQGDGRCTSYSLIEDRHQYAHAASDPLVPYLVLDFDKVHAIEARYYQLSPRLLNLPLWIWHGVPMLQPWRIHQSLWVDPA